MAASAVSCVVKFRSVFSSFQALGVKNRYVRYENHNLLRCVQSLNTFRSATYRFYSSETGDNHAQAKPKAKTEPKPRITLIGTDKKMTVVLQEEAEKIAKRRDLKLVKVSDLDTKSQRPVFRLESLATPRDNAHKVKVKTVPTGGLKGEKQVSFSPKISQHDIESRTKQINKWLQKSLEVRVTINGSAGDKALMEQLSQVLEKTVSEFGGRVVQKRSKDEYIKFSILPPKPGT